MNGISQIGELTQILFWYQAAYFEKTRIASIIGWNTCVIPGCVAVTYNVLPASTVLALYL
jgi:hypothetical protein